MIEKMNRKSEDEADYEEEGPEEHENKDEIEEEELNGDNSPQDDVRAVARGGVGVTHAPPPSFFPNFCDYNCFIGKRFRPIVYTSCFHHTEINYLDLAR